jgi:hypothetical protein
MLGMNRFKGKDTEHPFDMSCLDGFNTIWLPQISDIEKTHTTPIYEMGKTMNEFIEDYNMDCAEFDRITNDDFIFIIGRGTIGNNSEESLTEALLEARRVYGRNAFHIIYSKSYGVVDTLRAFKSLEEDGLKMHADLMLCIDGYAPAASRLSVSKMYDNENGKRERRFFIPKNIKKAVALVQRRDGFKGLKIGRPNVHNRWNFVIRQKDVDSQAKYYSEYSDGYERRLKVSHFNMEEIVSTIRCCKYGGRTYTVNNLIQFHMRKYKEGKS